MKSFIFRPFFLALLLLAIAIPVLLSLFPVGNERPTSIDSLASPVESILFEPPNDPPSQEEVASTSSLQIPPIVLKPSRKNVTRKPDRVFSTVEKMTRRVSSSVVYVVSPLGRATGFFIDSKGHILTAKHVIGHTEAELEQARNAKRIQDQIIALEQQRLRTIRQKMTLLLPGPEKEQFQRLSDEKKKELFASIGRSRELDTLLRNGGDLSRNTLKDIHVFSPDGTELQIKKVTLGSSHDLALLQVNAAALHHTPLRPRTIPLRTGDRVFTAGYVEQSHLSVQQGKMLDNQQGLCSDIQLPKDGSGGPLLDRYGNVSGLHGGRLKDDSGNDCAIPILVAYDEFSSFLIPQIRAVKSKIYVSKN